jgi:hypothetical protein
MSARRCGAFSGVCQNLRVFISHSSADREFTLSVRDELVAQAPATLNLEVLLDQSTLVAGIPWPPQLHEMMACCHAAVLLLTESAVQSQWVLKEATILAWRAALDSAKFRLFIVKLPAVSDERLKQAGFGPLMLDQTQRVNADKGPDIAAAVLKELKLMPGATAALDRDIPLDSVVLGLSTKFRRVDDDGLEVLRTKLKLPPAPWQPSDYNQSPDAVLVARHLMRGQLGNYGSIVELMADLAEWTPTDVVTAIFRQLAPYWVPQEQAAELPALRSRYGSRSAALIGRFVGDYSAEMYVRRAHCGNLSVDFATILCINAGDLKDHIVTELCAWYRATLGLAKLGPDEDARETIELINRDTRVIYVVVVAVLPPEDVIRDLTQTFRRLRFLFGLRPEAAERDEESPDGWIVIDPAEEQRQLQFRAGVNRVIEKANRI